MQQLSSCIPIPTPCGEALSHVISDGCDCIASRRGHCEIIRFNLCSGLWKRYQTQREYDCLCCDWQEGCFWASARGHTGRLYCLDQQLREIDCISLSSYGRYGEIMGLSCDGVSDQLAVALCGGVLRIGKDGGRAQLCCTAEGCCITDVLCLGSELLLTSYEGERYQIELLDHGAGKLCSCQLDAPYIPRNLLFAPCGCPGEQGPIWVYALKQNRYPCLCACSLELGQLCMAPGCLYAAVCPGCGCESGPGSTDDILSSVAQMEVALSHILHAEGEKLQKLLKQSDDVQQILCTNREVNKTIQSVTQLEQLLCSKLRIVLENESCDPCRTQSPCCGCEGRNTFASDE